MEPPKHRKDKSKARKNDPVERELERSNSTTAAFLGNKQKKSWMAGGSAASVQKPSPSVKSPLAKAATFPRLTDPKAKPNTFEYSRGEKDLEKALSDEIPQHADSPKRDVTVPLPAQRTDDHRSLETSNNHPIVQTPGIIQLPSPSPSEGTAMSPDPRIAKQTSTELLETPNIASDHEQVYSTLTRSDTRTSARLTDLPPTNQSGAAPVARMVDDSQTHASINKATVPLSYGQGPNTQTWAYLTMALQHHNRGAKSHFVGLMESFASKVEARYNSVRQLSGRGYETPRLELLLEACKRRDYIYLLLHQAFCWFYIAQPGTKTTFEVLSRPWAPNHTLPVDALTWFAEFPVPLQTSILHAATFDSGQSLYATAIDIATALTQHWDPLQGRCIARRYPPLVSEMVQELKVCSVTLQQVIFRAMLRQMKGDNNPYLPEYEAIFQRNQSQCVSTTQDPDLIEKESRGDALFANEYRQIASKEGVLINHRPLANTPVVSRTPSHEFAKPQIASSRQCPHSESSSRPSSKENQPQSVPVSSSSSASLSGNRQQSHSLVTETQSIPGLAGSARHSHGRTPSANSSPHQTSTSMPSMPSNLGTVFHQHTVPQAPQVASQPWLQAYGAHSSPIGQQQYQNTHQFSAPNTLHIPTAVPNYWPQNNSAVVSHMPWVSSGLQETQAPQPYRMHLSSTGNAIPITRNDSTCPALPSQAAEKYFNHIRQIRYIPHAMSSKLQYQHHWMILTKEDLELRAKDIPRPNVGITPARYSPPGSLTYRIRCVKTQSSQLTSEEEWVAMDHSWPTHITISLNGQALDIRRPSQYEKCLPVDVTDLVRVGPNSLTVAVMSVSDTCRYIISLETVETITNSQIKKGAEFINTDRARQRIVSKLASRDPDIEVIDPQITLDLTDPFSATIYGTAARGRGCLHNQCFDLDIFLATRAPTGRNKSEPCGPDELRCPICKGDVRPKSLVIDGFFQDIRSKLDGMGRLDVKAVTVRAYGEWQIKEEDEGKCAGERGGSRKRKSSTELPDSYRRGITASVERKLSSATEVIELDDD